MADRFFAGTRRVNRFEWQSHFNQFLACVHAGS
jgi:hypothetical protein